jgi:hypothetical protein
MSNANLVAFADLLKFFVDNGCQISHNLWVHRQPLTISSNQEKNINVKEFSLEFSVEDILIFVLSDFEYHVDNGDLLVTSFESGLKSYIIYRIKKHPEAKSTISNIKSHLCMTIPTASLTNPISVNTWMNLKYSESELKKIIEEQKLKFNQRGILHAVSADEFTTHLWIPGKVEFHCDTADNSVNDYCI